MFFNNFGCFPEFINILQVSVRTGRGYLMFLYNTITSHINTVAPFMVPLMPHPYSISLTYIRHNPIIDAPVTVKHAQHVGLIINRHKTPQQNVIYKLCCAAEQNIKKCIWNRLVIQKPSRNHKLIVSYTLLSLSQHKYNLGWDMLYEASLRSLYSSNLYSGCLNICGEQTVHGTVQEKCAQLIGYTWRIKVSRCLATWRKEM